MEKQQLFIELAKKYEQMSEELSQVREQLTSAMKELEIGTFVQDPETKVVYQVVVPNGTFVHYKQVDYIRTKKEGERAGSMSMKKAEEMGFTLS